MNSRDGRIDLVESPRVIAWEITRRCALACKHCRGSARDMQYAGEFTTDECIKTIDSIAAFSKPILILTGGEPMNRPDIYDLAAHATKQGLHVVMAPCGHLITPETAQKLKDSGVRAISISIDGATEAAHDAFRGVPGAYARTLEGLQHAIDAGIPFQLNTTVTRQNADDLPALLDQAIRLGAKTFDLFFLVPTGRGAELRDLEISAEKQEELLNWVYEADRDSPIRVKTTCAPHYARIQKTRRGQDLAAEGGMNEYTGSLNTGKPVLHGKSLVGRASPKGSVRMFENEGTGSLNTGKPVLHGESLVGRASPKGSVRRCENEGTGSLNTGKPVLHGESLVGRASRAGEGACGREQGAGSGGHPHGNSAAPYVSGGCMGGKGFVFISHTGILQPCGFLDVPSGDLRAVQYGFKKAYLESKVFNDLRNEDGYHGKCGICAFRYACGGCRARAYANTGNYLDEEPGCLYEGRGMGSMCA